MNHIARRRSRRRERGQILPLVGLMALVLFAFAALALDGGLAFSDRRVDQNLGDDAALAGAHELNGVINTTDVSNAFNAARQDIVDGLNQLGVAGSCLVYTGTPNLANPNRSEERR